MRTLKAKLQKKGQGKGEGAQLLSMSPGEEASEEITGQQKMWQESQAKIYNKLGLAENGGMESFLFGWPVSQEEEDPQYQALERAPPIVVVNKDVAVPTGRETEMGTGTKELEGLEEKNRVRKRDVLKAMFTKKAVDSSRTVAADEEGRGATAPSPPPPPAAAAALAQEEPPGVSSSASPPQRRQRGGKRARVRRAAHQLRARVGAALAGGLAAAAAAQQRGGARRRPPRPVVLVHVVRAELRPEIARALSGGAPPRPFPAHALVHELACPSGGLEGEAAEGGSPPKGILSGVARQQSSESVSSYKGKGSDDDSSIFADDTDREDGAEGGVWAGQTLPVQPQVATDGALAWELGLRIMADAGARLHVEVARLEDPSQFVGELTILVKDIREAEDDEPDSLTKCTLKGNQGEAFLYLRRVSEESSSSESGTDTDTDAEGERSEEGGAVGTLRLRLLRGQVRSARPVRAAALAGGPLAAAGTGTAAGATAAAAPPVGRAQAKAAPQALAWDWGADLAVTDLTGDLRLQLAEVHRLHGDRPVAQAVLPLPWLMGRWGPDPGANGRVWRLPLAPPVRPKSYNRYGQYRKAVPGKHYPGFGLEKPEHHLGWVEFTVELTLSTQTALQAYLGSTTAASVAETLPLSTVDMNLGELKFILKRFARWPNRIKAAVIKVTDWRRRPLAALCALSFWSYTLLLAPGWQIPFIVVFALMAFGYYSKRDFTYPEIWNDMEQPHLTKVQAIEQKYKRLRTLSKKLISKGGKAASMVEKFVNIVTWENFQLSLVFYLLLLVAAGALALLAATGWLRHAAWAVGVLLGHRAGLKKRISKITKLIAPKIKLGEAVVFSTQFNPDFVGDDFIGYKYNARICQLYADPPTLVVMKERRGDGPDFSPVVDFSFNLSRAKVIDEFKSIVYETDQVDQKTGDMPVNGLGFLSKRKELLYFFNISYKGKVFVDLGFTSLQEKKKWMKIVSQLAFVKQKDLQLFEAQAYSEEGQRNEKLPAKMFKKIKELKRRHAEKSKSDKDVVSRGLVKRLLAAAPDDYDLEHQSLCRKLIDFQEDQQQMVGSSYQSNTATHEKREKSSGRMPKEAKHIKDK